MSTQTQKNTICKGFKMSTQTKETTICKGFKKAVILSLLKFMQYYTMKPTSGQIILKRLDSNHGLLPQHSDKPIMKT